MNKIQICENITLITDGFENFDINVVPDLLKHVDIWLSNALGQSHSICNLKDIKILRQYENRKYPECIDKRTCRHIHLCPISVKDDFHLCSWVYQFAHEYCHHLINGNMCAELCGLKWFEETICELSSIYCLHHMEQYYQGHREYCIQKYVNSIKRYRKALREEKDKTTELLHSYINVNLSLLSQKKYHRDKYKHIAFSILDLFIECPALWRIILNFGNTCKWQELSELFNHLEKNADATYINSLNKLRIQLLGS